MQHAKRKFWNVNELKNKWIQSVTVGIHQMHLSALECTWSVISKRKFQQTLLFMPENHPEKAIWRMPKTWNQVDKTIIIPGEEAFQGTWGPDPAWGRKSADATAAVCGCILWTTSTRTMPREMRTLVDSRVPSMIKTQPKRNPTMIPKQLAICEINDRQG